jgi:hypothetical protein
VTDQPDRLRLSADEFEILCALEAGGSLHSRWELKSPSPGSLSPIPEDVVYELRAAGFIAFGPGFVATVTDAGRASLHRDSSYMLHQALSWVRAHRLPSGA